jgi:hypothetical protein
MEKEKDSSIKKIEIDINIKSLVGLVLMFLVLFVLPVNIIYYMNNPQEIGPSIAGIVSDNSGRYYTLPIFNFQFDTQLRDPSTISFTIGIAFLLLAIVMIAIFFVDFRSRERKYKH